MKRYTWVTFRCKYPGLVGHFWVQINRQGEGLKAARLLMVLSSISPLVILWVIRGNSLIPVRYFVAFCALMAVLPNAFLWLRIWMAKKQGDFHERLSTIAKVIEGG